jgi:hypothetical protein
MVGPDRVVNAVGLNSVLVHSARLLGPALALLGASAVTFAAGVAAAWAGYAALARSRSRLVSQNSAEKIASPSTLRASL